MKRACSAAAALCLLATGARASAAATQPAKRSERACSLLTAADLERVLGLKGGAPLIGLEVAFTKDATHDHAGSHFTCQGTIGGRYLAVEFGSGPATAEGRRRARERLAESRDALRAKGYVIAADEDDAVRCWTIAAPAGDASPTALFSTTCAGTKGGNDYSITISASGASDLVPTAKLRALARTAASRLP